MISGILRILESHGFFEKPQAVCSGSLDDPKPIHMRVGWAGKSTLSESIVARPLA